MAHQFFGAVWLSGRVLTDRDTRMATISEVKVTDAGKTSLRKEEGWVITKVYIRGDKLIKLLSIGEEFTGKTKTNHQTRRTACELRICFGF
jgi:hypothetical protein